MMVTVIGRGHSGTRAMSHTLSASGVDMGAPLNGSGDLIPPEDMYAACRLIGDHVQYSGELRWDFSKLLRMKIPKAFTTLIESYLSSVLGSQEEHRGWKIPETTLAYPWIQRIFPDIRYIYWVRDPRDSILGGHVTDDLSRFNVPHEPGGTTREQRAISWKYQAELMKTIPMPKHAITVRFEDFVLDQERTLKRLERFLGIPLARIEVRPESVGRWKADEEEHDFECFQDDLLAFGYKNTR